MKTARLGICLLLLAAPVTAYAQPGTTPLLTGPQTLSSTQMEFAGYVTIEDAIDLFGVWRKGLAGGMDFGLRAGFTDFADGGLHLGGDLRYGLSSSADLNFAIVGGFQATLADRGTLLAVPIGVSLGADVGKPDRPVVVYGLPFLQIAYFNPDGFDSDTEVEFGVELGGAANLTQQLLAQAELIISSWENDEVTLALGLVYRR